MGCQIVWVTFLPSKKISLVFGVAHITSCSSGEEGSLEKYVCVFKINKYSFCEIKIFCGKKSVLVDVRGLGLCIWSSYIVSML